MERRIARDARFASDVSHELRSPLQTLRARSTTSAAIRDELSAQGATALDLLVRRSQVPAARTGSAGDLSPDADGSVFERGLVNITELVQHASARTGPTSHWTSARLRPISSRDRRQARTCAGPSTTCCEMPTSTAGRCPVEISRPGNSVRVAVEDDGPGVAPSERELVFERSRAVLRHVNESRQWRLVSDWRWCTSTRADMGELCT